MYKSDKKSNNQIKKKTTDKSESSYKKTLSKLSTNNSTTNPYLNNNIDHFFRGYTDLIVKNPWETGFYDHKSGLSARSASMAFGSSVTSGLFGSGWDPNVGTFGYNPYAHPNAKYLAYPKLYDKKEDIDTEDYEKPNQRTSHPTCHNSSHEDGNSNSNSGSSHSSAHSSSENSSYVRSNSSGTSRQDSNSSHNSSKPISSSSNSSSSTARNNSNNSSKTRSDSSNDNDRNRTLATAFRFNNFRATYIKDDTPQEDFRPYEVYSNDTTTEPDDRPAQRFGTVLRAD